MEPISLALLAPARRCNQACPRCAITEVFREPVRRFDLGPDDYVRFVASFVDSGIALRSVGFLGYEPTLPESWPYVEAVFNYARDRGIRRSFVTNGMLLAKRTKSVLTLDPQQIAVSLDGGTAEIHDRWRGLPGAFEASLTSLRRFLDKAPRLVSRVEIASTLHDAATADSLLGLPCLLRQLGIRRWLLSLALTRTGVAISHVTGDVRQWLAALVREAERHGVRPVAVDLKDGSLFGGIPGLQVVKTGSLERTLRLDPSGGVRTGDALMEAYDHSRVVQWSPEDARALEALRLAIAADATSRRSWSMSATPA